VATCVELLKRRNVKGGFLEVVYAELQENAPAHIGELLATFKTERDELVRRAILEILSESGASEALPLFVEQLRSGDESLRGWAERGLRKLTSPEARKALWETGVGKN
jgi:HEAT repeat protein